jgi:hypothetical protein
MLSRPCLGPPIPGLGSRLGLGGLDLTKVATGKEYNTFCLIKFAWKWLTMAPEAHWVQVLPDPDYGLKNIDPSPLKQTFPTTFVIKKFPSLTVAAADALQTLFRAPWPRGPKHSLCPGPCKVRPPYQIWWGLVQRCVFLYQTHTHTHTRKHRFSFLYKI